MPRPAILAAVAKLAVANMRTDLSSRLLAIIGPTGSGKSALAMEVARRVGAEILSVDAMQIYQGMNIGTAKPSAAEQRKIRHHLLNWVRPDETFSVARFVALANEVIADARALAKKNKL